MTTSRNLPHPSDAEPLRSDDDILTRVQALVGPASAVSTLWLLLIDGDDRQTPVVMPIRDAPRRPDHTVDGIGRMLEHLTDAIATDAGSGSVIFVRERTGPTAITEGDREWADALATMCARIGTPLRAMLASTPGGVLWVGGR